MTILRKWKALLEKVEELLAKSEHIDNEQPCRVNFDLFNASSLDFVIWASSSLTDAGI